MPARNLVIAWCSALLLVALACDSKRSGSGSGPAVSIAARDDLSPETAARVLAQVGDQAITLGDYVAALDRMDPLERLRYQTPERRQLLLKELIDTELLAREAERRGLDKLPQTEARLQQLMIDELRRTLRKSLPAAKDVPASDVERYYQAHRADFAQPERRRASVLVVTSAPRARELLAQAQAAPETWGLLVRTHSVLGPPRGVGDNASARPPLSLEGDIGLVSAPGTEKGVNPEVPEPVRKALFTLEKSGDIYPEVVPVSGKFFLVRLMSVAPPRQPTLDEVDATIRTKLLEAGLQEAEEKMTAELRTKYPIHVDQEAVAGLRVPESAPSPSGPAPTGQTKTPAAHGGSGAVAPAPSAASSSRAAAGARP